jgi:predicted DNA binding CopG/RHH family protein
MWADMTPEEDKAFRAIMEERAGYFTDREFDINLKVMNASKPTPPTDSLDAIAEFWDTHSLADYWDQTEPAEFEFDPQARRRYLVAIDPEVLARVRTVAKQKGLQTESLINLWLEQKLTAAAV